MPGFRRYFKSFPGNAEILSIEGTNTMDVAPPSQSLGAGVGKVLIVAEFENGPVNAPVEVFGITDMVTKLGGLGHPVGDNPHANCVAVKSGGDELWNGNGFIWISNKKFGGLIACRVDNSAGSVDFRRLACLQGSEGPYSAANGDTVQFTRDGATVVTSTFSGAKGIVSGTSGTYPTLFVGGETLEIKDDDDATRVIVMTAAEQTLPNVIARINAVLAKTVAFDNGGELDMRSSTEGGLGRMEVVGGTARSTLGLPVSATQQVGTTTVNSNTGGGAFTLRCQANVNGVLTDFDGTFTAGAPDTVTVVRDGLIAEMQGLNVSGVTFTTSGAADIVATGDANVAFTLSVVAEPGGGDMTIAATTPGVFTVGKGNGNVPNLALIQPADAVLVFDAAAGITSKLEAGQSFSVCNSGTAGTGTLQVTGGTAYAAFGFDLVTIADANDGEDVTIPAGTRVQDATATGTVWVTLSDVETGSTGGPFAAKVRPASDSDSAIGSGIADVTTVLDVLPGGFAVTNVAAINRLSASQLDARYKVALDATLADSSVASEAGQVSCARSSPSIMRYLKANAIEATATGLATRKAISRPPLAATVAEVESSVGFGVGAPGIGRDDRVMYVFPGATTQIPEVQSVGARGGLGFSDNGIVQVAADSYYASVRSLLPAEENAGQDLAGTSVGAMNILSLEDAYEPSLGGVGLKIGDYKRFKAAGIIALKQSSSGSFEFQSDVTSVNPATQLELADANRRYLADFVIDSLNDIANVYVKKPTTPQRNRALLKAYRDFLLILQSPNQENSSRIEAFNVVDDTSKEQKELGMVIMIVKVKMYAAMKSIVNYVTVGTNVTIEQGQ